MINETRAAEAGGEIIEDTSLHTFTRRVIALKALEDTVISAITAAKPVVTNLDYYNGKTLYSGETIDANVATLTLTSGAVQAYYQA
jgi:hypothetical protein